MYLDALTIAKLSLHDAARVGSSLFVGGRVVSRAPNTGIYHSEVRVIANCPRAAIRGSTIAIARIWKTGNPANSLPCHRCLAYLKARKISRIIALYEGQVISFSPGDERYKRPIRPWNTPRNKSRDA